MNGSHMTLDIGYRTFIRAVIVGAGVLAVFYLAKIIVALLFAVVIASGIEPGVRWFRRWRVPRIAAVLLIYLLAAAFLVSVLALAVPRLIDEFTSFLNSFPRYQRVLLQELRSFEGLPFFDAISQNAERFVLDLPLDLQTIGSGALDLLITVFGGIASAIVLVVVSFYLASQERGIEQFLRLVTPLRDEEYVIDLWNRTQKKLGLWLRGQLILAVAVGVLVYFVLTLLNIPYALILALVAALFEVVPIIGPILAAIPAVFLGFLQSPQLGFTIAGAYVLIQQLESHLLVPVVMRQAVGLNPLIVILSLLAGATLGGVLGMFLAVPVASAFAEFLTDTDRKKRGLFSIAGKTEQ